MTGEINLIRGSVDMHVHAAPDAHARKTDCLELVQKAREYGMRGVLIKDHVTLTSDRAFLLNKIYPDFKVYGALVLNYPVGGLNPTAVEGAVKLGCRVVFMPTYCANNHISVFGKTRTLHGYPFPQETEGIKLLNSKGKLVPEVVEILEVISKTKVTLATGHISPLETRHLLKEAKSLGVEKIIVTHASFKKLTFLEVPEQIEAIKLGAFIEHCFVTSTILMGGAAMTSVEEIAEQVRKVGVDHCVLSTDLGQTGNPHPVIGFGEFAFQMHQRGFSETEIEKMIRDNPLRLLED